MISRSLKEHAQTQAVTDANWGGIDGWLSTIDIANDETIIGTNGNDDIFLRFGIGGKWQKMPGKLRQVSTGGKDKYVGVNEQKLFI
jgi:hypothetical protein